MQAVTLKNGEPLAVKGIPVPGLRVQVVNAIRMWVDTRGKTHFDVGRACPHRAPANCPHRGTFRVQGRIRRYVWSRGAAFGLRCGDCGTPLT